MQYIIGVDVGGTKIDAGLVSYAGKIADSFVIPTQAKKGKGVVIRNIVLCIENILTKETSKQVSFVGVGFPAPVNDGIIRTTTNLPGWNDVNLKKILEKKLKKKVLIENDANCFALAELNYGAGKNRKIRNIVGVTLGTGIGAGIIIDRKLYKGSTGAAGEYSHIPIGDKMFDYYASGYLKELKKKHGFNMDIQDIEDIAQKGTGNKRKKARQLFKEYGKGLGVALSAIANTLDPDVIVLGGSISKSYSLFEKEMKKEFNKHVFPETAKRLKIVSTKLEKPGILGAGCLGE